MKHFMDKRFGMFIHCGPVSLRGAELSWSHGREIHTAEYDTLYKEFNPTLFNADFIVKTAKDAGMVTVLKPESVARYKELHANVWSGVLKNFGECNITNYSIYLKEIEGKPYRFSYWEYTGKDFDADMKKMAGDTTTQRWWKETSPLQQPLSDAEAKG